MAQRLAFAKANLDRNWRLVVFTDRKKFLFGYPGTSVSQAKWVQKGQRHEAPTVNHPMTVNVYAGITMYGVTKLHMVAGTSKIGQYPSQLERR